jgi:hypothetical protein
MKVRVSIVVVVGIHTVEKLWLTDAGQYKLCLLAIQSLFYSLATTLSSRLKQRSVMKQRSVITVRELRHCTRATGGYAAPSYNFLRSLHVIILCQKVDKDQLSP